MMSDLNSAGKERLGYLDILRGFGIIFIVLGHITYDRSVLNWLYSFHVPLFFFAAGAVYKKRPVLEDLKRRALTVLLPYFIFGALELSYWQLLERRFRPSTMSFEKSALGLLLGRFDYLDFNTHLWFLPCFFVTVTLFNAAVNIGGKKLGYALAAVMSVVFVLFPLPEMFWGVNRVYRYIGFYVAGAAVSQLKLAEKFTRQKIAAKIFEAVLLLAASVALSYFGLGGGAMFFVTALIGTGGVLAVSLIIGKCRPLQYLGRISLVILCVHGAVYRIILKLLSMLLSTDTDIIRDQLWVIPVTTLTLALCAAVYEVLSRIAPIMTGRKRAEKPRK